MNVLVTGPEGSGTRYVTALLTEAGADALHRSMPHGPDWTPTEAADFDAVVVVIRSARAHLASLQERIPEITSTDAARERRRSALTALAPLWGSAHVVTYEGLASEVEARFLLTELGLDPTATDRVPWHYANRHRNGDLAVPIGWRVDWSTVDGVYTPRLVKA